MSLGIRLLPRTLLSSSSVILLVFNHHSPSAVMATTATMHVKCLDNSKPYLGTKNIIRTLISKEMVPWTAQYPDYKPVKYTCQAIMGAPWADPDISEPNFHPKWNTLDGQVDRRSFTGEYALDGHRYPLNPMGRTGISGRGILGKWGPNHAADPVVTRWKRSPDTQEVAKDSVTQKPILQFVSILRGDVHHWAIPGGMVDPGEQVSMTLKREFGEEALNCLKLSEQKRLEFEKSIEKLFSKGTEIFKGYVDDPRNTDNAWMETVAVNFHDETGETLNKIELEAGSDAAKVHWMDISSKLDLYASHLDIIRKVAQLHDANW